MHITVISNFYLSPSLGLIDIPIYTSSSSNLKLYNPTDDNEDASTQIAIYECHFTAVVHFKVGNIEQ